MGTKIYKTYTQFLCRKDLSDNGVSEFFAKHLTNWKEDNATNTGCWNCVNCRYCTDRHSKSFENGKGNAKGSFVCNKRNKRIQIFLVVTVIVTVAIVTVLTL